MQTVALLGYCISLHQNCSMNSGRRETPKKEIGKRLKRKKGLHEYLRLPILFFTGPVARMSVILNRPVVVTFYFFIFQADRFDEHHIKSHSNTVNLSGRRGSPGITPQ